MPTVREIRASLVDLSRRYSRVAHEVEDVAHDIIASALRRDAPIDGDAFVRGLHGAARRHGAFVARCAGRRRAREAYVAGDHVERSEVDADHDHGGGAPLSVLSPALRTTLLLLLLGLEKSELRYVLGVSDAALRKRFQALRDHGPLARPEPTSAPASGRLRRSQVALLPRLTDTSRNEQAPRVLATSDPDGHGMIFTEVLTIDRRAATPDAAAPHERPVATGNPC